jgi:hypothetical protein
VNLGVNLQCKQSLVCAAADGIQFLAIVFSARVRFSASRGEHTEDNSLGIHLSFFFFFLSHSVCGYACTYIGVNKCVLTSLLQQSGPMWHFERAKFNGLVQLRKSSCMENNGGQALEPLKEIVCELKWCACTRVTRCVFLIAKFEAEPNFV